MKITNEEWASLITGWVQCFDTEDGFTFRRFTEGQIASQNERGRTLQPTTTAGMFLEIEGDIKKIAFDYSVVIGTTRRFYGFSVLENGEKKYTLVKDLQVDSGHLSYEPTGPCRLTIFFPDLSATYFKNMEIEGEYRHVPRKRKLFIAGDSITQGYDAKEPHRCYANRLQEAMMAEGLNQAIGGDIYNVKNLDFMPDFKPDAAVINYGTNDWARESDVPTMSYEYLKRLREIFPTTRIFVLEPIWRKTEGVVKEKTGYTVADVRRYVRESAEKVGLEVIPGMDLVPHDPIYFSDGSLHPNDEGFDFYADNLIRELKARAPELFE